MSDVPVVGGAGHLDEDAPLPAVNDVRQWLDRINLRHQGRVTAVDPVARVVTLTTVHGGTATVPASSLLPVDPSPDDAAHAAARLAQVGHAQQWLEVTLPQRLEDCVTGAWDAMTALHPDDQSDDLKVRAAQHVAEAAADLAKRVREHVEAKGTAT